MIKSLTLALPKVASISSVSVVAFALFTIPLTIAGPQLIVGSAVNLFLFLVATIATKRQLLVLAFLPSLAAVMHGVLFGPFTISLVYLLPFIWLGNLGLMFLSRYLLTVQCHWVMRILTSAFMKMVFLNFCAYTLFQAHLIPAILVTAMGTLQLVTAMVGGILAYVVEKNKWVHL